MDRDAGLEFNCLKLNSKHSPAKTQVITSYFPMNLGTDLYCLTNRMYCLALEMLCSAADRTVGKCVNDGLKKSDWPFLSAGST